MTAIDFNPGLNRVTFGNFAALPSEMRGQQAHTWLATWGLARRMARRFPALDLPPIPDEIGPAQLIASAGYPAALNALVEQGQADALAFADQLGIALAALIATLHHAPAEAREAREEWPDTHWERWTKVRQIVLGGGVLSGSLGVQMVKVAREWLPKLDAGELTLHLPDHPRLLMLTGAARRLSDGAAVVMDAGHTALKCAFVQVAGGEVQSLEPLPLRPVLYSDDGEKLLDFLLDSLVEACPPDVQVNHFGLSLSIHMDETGQPPPFARFGSLYSPLADYRLPQEVTRRLTERLGYPVTVRPMHEGQAAVHALPDLDAAVLLGTSVGGALK